MVLVYAFMRWSLLLLLNAYAGAQRWCSRSDGAVESSDIDFNFSHSLTL